jgi:cytochrome c oxidase subunit III
MWLFLASLTMLFGSGMLGYIIIRLFAANAEDLRRAELPLVFLLSTVVVVAGSFTIQLAVAAVRRELQARMRSMLYATLALAVVFCLLQIPGLWTLWQQHLPRELPGANLAKLIAVFIVLHAAHVLGGVVFLVMAIVKARRGGYDHENYIGVKHAALYWHFLDAVWIIMYGTMLVLG